jgi:hypothetical protein
MTTYTVTSVTNITALSGKTGSDTYNVNGGKLTIDSDTRYGVNTTTTTGAYGNIILSATLGGELTIDGTNVWQFAFSAATGTVPASGAIITQGAVTAELIWVGAYYGGTIIPAGGVWTTGAWCKVRNLTGGTFSAGAATVTGGAVMTISTVPVRSWIEVAGVESLSLTVNRLNKLTMNGDWYYPVMNAAGTLTTTSGVRGQSIQLPCYIQGGTAQIMGYPGVEVETAPGSNVYAHWPNTGQMFLAANHSTDSRSRFCRISTGGVLVFGKDSTNTDCGELPVSGCKIRIPNIITSNTNSTVGYAVNAAPSLTMGTRYELATQSSGTVDIRRVTGAWYMNIQQPYSTYIRDLHTCDQFVLAEVSTPADIDGLMVGLSNQATPYASNSVVFQQCLNGGTAKNVTGVRAQQISTSGYSVYFVNLYGGWVLDNIRGAYAQDATALSGPIFFNTCDSFTATNLSVVGKRLIVSGCSNWTIANLTYADNPKSTTGATVSTQAVELMSGCRNGTLSNIINWPGVADVHPLGGMVYMNTCSDILVTDIGTSVAPFACGSVAGTRTGYLFADGGINKNIKFQRNWLNTLRIGLTSSTNTSQTIRFQNCYNTDATLTQGPNWYNSISRGNRQNSGTVPTSYTHVDGMHWWDAFTADTTTRVALVFTEKSTATASAYTIDSGTPKFTSTGTCVMQTAGDQITWTMPYYMLGWNGASTFAVTGTNATTNHLIQYDIDKGAGFSGSFKTLSNTNLAAETGISPTTGVKFKIRIACTVTATANTLTSLVINGTTTLAIQNAALYPLDSVGLTLTNVKPGSDIVVYVSGTTTVLDTGDSVGASTYTYSYTTIRIVDIAVFLSGYRPYFIRNYLLSATAASIPIAQEIDRTYA